MSNLRPGVFLQLLIYLVISIPASYSQIGKNIRFDNLSKLDGIPHNSINSIIQDDLGFIWIGTNDGLCRYQGSNDVSVYRVNAPEIQGGLESNAIRTLFKDHAGNLWIGTRLGGLTKFDQSNQSWTTFRHDPNDANSISSDEILSIAEDNDGRIWIGTEDGLNAYDPSSGVFTRFQADLNNPKALQAKAILTIYVDHKGWMWTGTWDGGLSLLIHSDSGKLSDIEFKTFELDNIKETRRVWDIYQSNNHHYWLSTAGGGLLLMALPDNANNTSHSTDWTPITQRFSKESDSTGLTHDDIKEVVQDRNQNLWVATTQGLNVIPAEDIKNITEEDIFQNAVDLSFTQYYFDPANPSSIINNNFRALYEDFQGIIWAGTSAGISQYNWSNHQIDVDDLSQDITQSFVSQNFYINPKGIAWIANGERGLLKYDLENKKFLSSPDFARTYDFVNCLYSPDDRHLYISHTAGITKLDLRTNKTKVFNIFNESIPYSFVRSLYRDNSNRIWVGSENGLIIVDESSGVSQRYVSNINNNKSISDNSIKQILRDSRGDIWLATFQGLNKVQILEDGTLEFIHLKHDPQQPENSIPSNRIFCMVEHDKILYLASDIGLSSYNTEQGTYENYSKDGSKYSFHSIEVCADGNIWGGTTDGIVKFDTQSKSFNAYDKNDGLGDVEFIYRGSQNDRQGRLYFLGHRGIALIDPTMIVKNERPPDVYITDLIVLNKNGQYIANVLSSQEVTLTHEDYYISIDYAAINYNRSTKNEFAFKLDGFDERWNYPDKKTPVVYTNLDHGTYTFQVKAANNDGVWNEEGARLTIIKKPAFWETIWFRVLSVLIGLILLYLAITAYTHNIKQRNNALQKYNEDLNSEVLQRRKVEEVLKLQEQNLRESNSNLEKSNNELERSNKDLEQFAYIASHDLQEPLRVVANFIGLLKHRYANELDQDAHGYIDFATNGISRMSAQIESILTFSRVIQNQHNLSYAHVDGLISTALHDLSQIIEDKQAEVVVDPMPQIYCDSNLIRMVFYNLILNAIKFNKSDHAKVKVGYHTNQDDEFWHFTVADNGIGIAEEHLETVFHIFKRLHSKSDYEGTGIGLALCQKIIHRHDGEIWVDSQEGVRSTFHFTIKKPTDLPSES
jgi:signal transduction histidine kinase/ligand-binding sensor domain-containing protein